MKIPIVIIKFLFIGALFILSNHNLHIQNPADLSTFQEIYYDWLSGIFDQTKVITGYVSNANWLPDPSDSVVVSK